MIEYPEPGQVEIMSPRGRFGPLDPDHALVGRDCVLCDYPLRAGDVPTLVKKQDGDHDGLTIECVGVHQRCAYGVGAS